MNRTSKMRIGFAACAAVGVGIFTSIPARGAVNYTLNPSKDNTLIQGDPGFDYSNGTGQLYVGEVGLNGNETNRRAVMKFDLSPTLPAGSWIHTASLTVNVSRSHFVSSDVSLYRVLADWGQGTSGGLGSGSPATAGDATWWSRFFGSSPATPWNTPGGDFATPASATVNMGFNGPYTFMTADVIRDVQRWMDSSSTNFGWLLKDTEDAPQSAKELDSRESFSTANRPALKLNYTMGGDADDNNTVDLTDFTLLAANFNGTNRTFAQGDFSRDGTVDLTDFTILAANFNKTAPSNGDPAGAPVPEPTAAGLFAVVTALLPRRARRRA